MLFASHLRHAEICPYAAPVQERCAHAAVSASLGLHPLPLAGHHNVGLHFPFQGVKAHYDLAKAIRARVFTSDRWMGWEKKRVGPQINADFLGRHCRRCLSAVSADR